GMDPNVAPERRYRLVVVASDITRQRMVRIPWYVQREYGIAPDTVPVADAVRMSTAIPFFYLPFKLHSHLSGQDSLMVDGGLNAADFSIDRSTRERLYADGYSATQQFLGTFSFTEYCRVWTRPAMSG